MTVDRLPTDDPNWGWEFRYEDFVYARICEEAKVASELPQGPARHAATVRLDGLRTLLSEHSIYVDTSGHNYGRCFTCAPVHGIPCTTVIALAQLWPGHCDSPVPANWAPKGEPGSFWEKIFAAGTHRRKFEARATRET